jgi:hypothetical protein
VTLFACDKKACLVCRLSFLPGAILGAGIRGGIRGTEFGGHHTHLLEFGISNEGDERVYYCQDANFNVTALVDAMLVPSGRLHFGGPDDAGDQGVPKAGDVWR